MSIFWSDCVCCKTSDLAYLYTSCNRRTRRSRRRLAVLRPSASHATVRLSKADSLYRACPGANGAESEVRRAWWYSRSNTPPQVVVVDTRATCTSTRLSCWTNRSSGCRVRAFVNPSAFISVVDTHSTSILPCCTSWRNQCWCMSTCLRRVVRRGSCAFSRRIVCWLSAYIFIPPSILYVSPLNSLFQAISSFAVRERASSSASVLNVVTVSCFDAFQSTGPPYRVNRYPSELFLSRLSANAESE